MTYFGPFEVAIVTQASQAVATNINGILGQVVLSAGTATGEAIIYAGSSTSGKKLLHVNCIANNAAVADPVTAFAGGLYVDVNGEIDAVNLYYR